MTIVPFQAFADSSRGGIVERHRNTCKARRAYASCWICHSFWQQSIALFNFNELWQQKLINSFNATTLCVLTLTSISRKADIKFCWNKWELINSKLNYTNQRVSLSCLIYLVCLRKFIIVFKIFFFKCNTVYAIYQNIYFKDYFITMQKRCKCVNRILYLPRLTDYQRIKWSFT